MKDWTEDEIRAFVEERTGQDGDAIEGPAVLGDFLVWRCWTWDKKEWHAHYVLANEESGELALKNDFQNFANWLMRAFNAKDLHARRLDWLKSIVATITMLTLLALVVWAVIAGRATGVDFRWLVGTLAASSIAYLLGGGTGAVSRLARLS